MRNSGDYYLGLDIGTGSIGWAVTDTKYKLLKFNGKTMWGARLFDNANTAAERRVFRSNRRRMERRKQRIALLEELFSAPISEVDMGFFQRLKDSQLYSDDKAVNQTNTLFNSLDYKDKDYYKEYPTIYHLRNALLSNADCDVRLLYLAAHHMIKNRGHFLYSGKDMEAVGSVENLFIELNTFTSDRFSISFELNGISTLNQQLKEKSLNITKRAQIFTRALNACQSDSSEENAMQKAWIMLISGGNVKIKNLFNLEQYEGEIDKFSFDDNYEEKVEGVLIDALGDDFELIARLRAIYNWSKITNVMGDNTYISGAMVEKFEKHKADLKILKKFMKDNYPEKYAEVFKSAAETDKCNYCHYIGMTKINGKKQQFSKNKCSADDFYKYLKKLINEKAGQLGDNQEYKYIIDEIAKNNFLPKQISKNNSIIPYQLNKCELKAILDNASIFHPFLNEVSDGVSTKEKILLLLEYKIPYYVGPVNVYHKGKVKGVWAERKSADKVRPWNFDKVIDLYASAEQFICKMTNKCAYLAGADVLPKNSLLYSEYCVLNELNNLRVDNNFVSLELKQKIYRELFCKQKKVTGKGLFNWLVANGHIEKYGKPEERLSGFDKDFQGSLSSYITFQSILGDGVENTEMIENIIKWITLFSDKDILSAKIDKEYGEVLTEQEKKEIKKLNYSGWGRLSRDLLQDVKCTDKEGEMWSIIDLMRQTNFNFMEIYFKYGFDKIVSEMNLNINNTQDITYAAVENLACSPAVKRQIWQNILVVKELRKVMKTDPKKLFIEMSRGEDEGSKKNGKKRTVSRKERLLELYKACEMDSDYLLSALDKKTDNELRSDRLYLYFTQLGKCMYSGESISLNELYDNNLYDIDHIYPQSKVKDDSIDNRVLVKKTINADKTDIYPIKSEIQTKNISHWKLLKEKGFISDKKYQRLTRKEEFSQGELEDFIDRQLVETRQSTKIVAELLQRLFPETEVVYVKAHNVSEFRQKFEIIKVRDLNDLHHAKDAYLNIVVGNAYNTKFNHNAKCFYQHGGGTYNFKRLFDFNIGKADNRAWCIDAEGKTIDTVKKYVLQNDVLISKHSYVKKGAFYDQNIKKKGKDLISVKAGSPLANTERYGGYGGVSPAYFSLVEYPVKSKTIRSLEAVPTYLAAAVEKSDTALKDYLIKALQVKELKVLIPKIKMKTLFKLGNSYIYLAGYTGKQLLWHNANELKMSENDAVYVKKLIRFKEKAKKFNVKADDLTAVIQDGIDKDSNLRLYDIFINKLRSKPYADICLTGVADTLEKRRNEYICLTVEGQALLLLEILSLFQCNPIKANLTRISEDANVGTVRTNKKISGKDFSIVNVSATGLFNREIPLNKLV